MQINTHKRETPIKDSAPFHMAYMIQESLAKNFHNHDTVIMWPPASIAFNILYIKALGIIEW